MMFHADEDFCYYTGETLDSSHAIVDMPVIQIVPGSPSQKRPSKTGYSIVEDGSHYSHRFCHRKTGNFLHNQDNTQDLQSKEQQPRP